MTGPAHYREPDLVQSLVATTLAALDLPVDFIRPGDRVVLKPNWVKEHDERHPGPDQWEHVVTHPAVIEAVTRWRLKDFGVEARSRSATRPRPTPLSPPSANIAAWTTS